MWELAATLTLFVLATFVAVFWQRNAPRLPKGYASSRRMRPQAEGSAAAPAATRAVRDCTRNRFKANKVPRDVDFVVIGSGMGGLFCAGALAKAGKRVVVLEQHYVTGGCTHEFADKGFSFDTGLHYVGRIEKYSALLDAVSDRDHRVHWSRIGSAADGFVYDQIALGNNAPFKLPSGKEQFITALVRKFPQEEAAIRKYVDLCIKVNKSADPHFMGKSWPKLVQRLVSLFAGATFNKYSQRTVQEVLDGLTDNKHLKALLCGQFGDYGLAPEQASFFIHAGVVAHYMGGAYYPQGGPQEISRAIIPVIHAAGGAVLVRAEVCSILVGKGGAYGVQLTNGEKVEAAEGVISAAGALTTFTKLLTEEARALLNVPVTQSAVNGVEQGMSHMYFFIGIRGSQAELQLPTSNLWYLPCGPDFDLNAMRAKVLQDPFGAPEILMFAGFPSAKDPTFNDRYPDKSTCVVITEMPTSFFKAWSGRKSGKRGAEYEALKAKFKDRILGQLFSHFPQLRDRVQYFNTASPLSNEFYLGRSDSYGMEPTPRRFTPVTGGCQVETGIPHLYLAGQDMAASGIVGALLGGGITAGHVLGYNALDCLLLNRTIFGDLMTLHAKEEAEHLEREQRERAAGAGSGRAAEHAGAGSQQ